MNDSVEFGWILQGWEGYQERLVTAVSPLTPDQLALQIKPQLRSVMTLTAHIIAARVWWFHFVMQEGEEALKPLVKWDDDGEPARTAVELVSGLNQTWRVIQTGLGRWTATDLSQTFQYRWPGTNEPQTFTRQWIIWHVLEHDIHHGGELSFVLGAHRLPAIEL